MIKNLVGAYLCTITGWAASVILLVVALDEHALERRYRERVDTCEADQSVVDKNARTWEELFFSCTTALSDANRYEDRCFKQLQTCWTAPARTKSSR